MSLPKIDFSMFSQGSLKWSPEIILFKGYSIETIKQMYLEEKNIKSINLKKNFN